MKKVLALVLGSMTCLSAIGCRCYHKRRQAPVTKEKGLRIESSINLLKAINKDVLSEPIEIGEYATPSDNNFDYVTCNGGIVITGYSGTEETICIPEQINGKKVIKIGEQAFVSRDIKNWNLVGVKIPDTVREIEPMAFAFSLRLSDVHIGKNVEKIGKAAFIGCINLKEITLPDSVKEIEEESLSHCEKLETISLSPHTIINEDSVFPFSPNIKFYYR